MTSVLFRRISKDQEKQKDRTEKTTEVHCFGRERSAVFRDPSSGSRPRDSRGRPIALLNLEAANARLQKISFTSLYSKAQVDPSKK